MSEGLMFALVAAVLALIYGVMSIRWILRCPPATTACGRSPPQFRKALRPT